MLVLAKAEKKLQPSSGVSPRVLGLSTIRNLLAAAMTTIRRLKKKR
jgi:hypothetical protein